MAHYWAHGPTVNEKERQELTAEMRAFGATDEDIENYLKANTAEEDCIVIEENWPVLQWFLAIDDQFEYVQGVCTGIDIASIQADVQMSAREYTPEQYKHLRFLTKCVTRELNSRLEK
ncbi:hypothetical protein [Idiomarina sp.]|uniref:hypothetical protein n=1 Tax=Idiomarina sp. TaxID=1874361 RepID=UPI0025B99EAA|nr:hypothetical protein [Idiomarina sp.]